jgi:hypothetical protein
VTHPDVDADLDHMTEADGDCDDSNPGVYTGAPELCDGIDNNCNSDIDEGLARIFYEDYDGDGYGNADAVVNDQCVQPEGYLLTAGDCNDRAATIHPGAAEVCDEEDVDEDCDKFADNDDPNVTNARIFWTDADGDGYGDAGAKGTRSCDDLVGQATNAYDCDDSNAAVNPNQLEICDGLAMDDDCDGLVDDADSESLKLDYWPDNDGDGFGNDLTPVSHTCFDLLDEGYVRNNEDCDDTRPVINPDATEVCNDALVDEDCDGDVDEADSDTTVHSWYVDDDSDGYGLSGSTPVVTCQVVAGSATRAGDCNDADAAINPGQDELCNPARTSTRTATTRSTSSTPRRPPSSTTRTRTATATAILDGVPRRANDERPHEVRSAGSGVCLVDLRRVSKKAVECWFLMTGLSGVASGATFLIEGLGCRGGLKGCKIVACLGEVAARERRMTWVDQAAVVPLADRGHARSGHSLTHGASPPWIAQDSTQRASKLGRMKSNGTCVAVSATGQK